MDVQALFLSVSNVFYHREAWVRVDETKGRYVHFLHGRYIRMLNGTEDNIRDTPTHEHLNGTERDESVRLCERNKHYKNRENLNPWE